VLALPQMCEWVVGMGQLPRHGGGKVDELMTGDEHGCSMLCISIACQLAVGLARGSSISLCLPHWHITSATTVCLPTGV
jgi:hypothetical protein